MTEVIAALERVVARLPGGGEPRPGQVEMAAAIAAALQGGRHVVVQAGTGTGKSLGYLVPALLSGKKIVVSTATKALQDQLAGKDLPFLQSVLGEPFEFAVLKGRSNYLCRQRAAEVAGGDDDQLTLDEVAPGDTTRLSGQITELLRWAAGSETGDRSELAFEPTPQAWSQVSVTSVECPGAGRCPMGDVCFAEVARGKAEQADVVVVNSHLYGAHLASGGHVLPEHDVVVFDEAHELEDIAAVSLGLELSGGRFAALARSARPLVAANQAGLAEEVAAVGARWSDALATHVGDRLDGGLDAHLATIATLARQRVDALASAVRADERDTSEVKARRARVLQMAGHLAGDLAYALEPPATHVAWVEGPAHNPLLKIAAVEVGEVLAERLWGVTEAVLTSATIPPLLTERLGIPPSEVDELDVGSPFDYASQALLYCPVHLPDPRNPAYEVAMHEELKALITAAGGRTLALFTSWRAMEAAAEKLREGLPGKVLTQSELPKPALLEVFATDETSSLFATMGFWQGVDIPGRALSLVVIDKLPFPRPDDPLMRARRDRAGSAAFRVIDLPRASTLLAQGSGRLIRTSTDRGVVAVLDPRLGKANYAWDLVRALPPFARTRERAVAEAFLAEATGASAATPTATAGAPAQVQDGI